MKSNEDLVSVMDLLDLDEEVIDNRLRSIMDRKKHSNKNLVSAVHLLKYKQLINEQEKTECDNEVEYKFAVNLIQDLHPGNVVNVCNIISLVLGLNPSSLVNKSEHFLQQVLADIDTASNQLKDQMSNEEVVKIILSLKICDGILDTLINKSIILYLPLLEIPLDNILDSSHEKLKTHFLGNTVSKLFKAVTGYNILDSIWHYIERDQDRTMSAKILSNLSDLYLPSSEEKEKTPSESILVHKTLFWEIILKVLTSVDPAIRKLGIYLAKRAIDNIVCSKKDVNVRINEQLLFVWDQKDNDNLTMKWDNYFTLLDSLAEKQSNIVLPSLQLLNKLQDFGHHWMDCAFYIGFKHDKTDVKLKCLKEAVKRKIYSKEYAVALLEALNDIDLYDKLSHKHLMETEICTLLEDDNNLAFVLESIPAVVWSPVPLYSLTRALYIQRNRNILEHVENSKLAGFIVEILKIPCNHILLRYAIHKNIQVFVENNCIGLGWEECVYVSTAFQFDIHDTVLEEKCLLAPLIKHNKWTSDEDKHIFLTTIAEAYTVNFVVLYVKCNPDDGNIIARLLKDKINDIRDILSRQYSDRRDCLHHLLFISQLYNITLNLKDDCFSPINETIELSCKILLQYIACLLTDTELNIAEIKVIFKELNFIKEIKNEDLLITVLDMFKFALMILKDHKAPLNKRVIGVLMYDILSNNELLKKHHRQEFLTTSQLVQLFEDFLQMQTDSSSNKSKYMSLFIDKSCEILYNSLFPDLVDINTSLSEYVMNACKCGGPGSLKWCIKIINRALKELFKDEKFVMQHFVYAFWHQLDNLKSNNQYAVCSKEVVEYLTNSTVLNRRILHAITTIYCNVITHSADVRNTPLFHLVTALSEKDVLEESTLWFFCEIILFDPAPRKDQRILNNTAVEILTKVDYKIPREEVNKVHFNYQIQQLAFLTVSKITDTKYLKDMVGSSLTDIYKLFDNKKRYHENSNLHRSTQMALQVKLLILLKCRTENVEETAIGCMRFLGVMAHQKSVRVCLEWYIALYIYIENIELNKELLDKFNSNNIPVQSQLNILYWVLKRRLIRKTYKQEEYDFVTEMFLSNTIGAIFNTRLLSQYYLVKLESFGVESNKTTNVISKALENEKEKNLIKLKKDYFANDFDIVTCLTPPFIIYFLPRYCNPTQELVDFNYVKDNLGKIDSFMARDVMDEFKKEWEKDHLSSSEVFSLDLPNKIDIVVETTGASETIQKKYIPWKSMDVNGSEEEKKRESSSELVVVASLIDKLPNLGGMARTSEVFGVKTYVVDSLRHLQDKQFQGLSVSAERWVNIEEVRPGPPLKEYITKMKDEGYTVVAAEQTSTSCPLQTFKFPKKTLLLLGHEKEGIPCNLLPLMDHCVEVPQQGFVRSLNVHVTAAIFIWEYSRQNML